MEVAVVGAGIVGASVAYGLSRAGAGVWIIDRNQPASGTTAASWGWVNASAKADEQEREYFELNRAGLAEHYRLRSELGGASWFHPDGALLWAGDGTHEAYETHQHRLEDRVERLRAWGYAAEWLGASEVNETLEPGVAFQGPDTPVAFFPEEGWVDPAQLAASLTKRARANGARTRFGSGVQAIRITGGSVSSVVLENGERLPVEAVVNAAGPGACKMSSLVGLPLGMRPTKGLLVRLAVGEVGEVGEPPVGRLVHSAHGVNLRPDGPGYVLIHHHSTDAELWRGADEGELATELVSRAREVVPALETAQVAEKRVGVRAIPADGFPCIGELEKPAGYYEAVTHSGVTLAPLIGRLLAREIVVGEAAEMLAPFRPDRLGRGRGVQS